MTSLVLTPVVPDPLIVNSVTVGSTTFQGPPWLAHQPTDGNWILPEVGTDALSVYTAVQLGYQLGHGLHGLLPVGSKIWHIDSSSNVHLSYNPLLPAVPFGNFVQALGDIDLPMFGSSLRSGSYGGNCMDDPFNFSAARCGPLGGFPWGYGPRGKIVGDNHAMSGVGTGSDVVQFAAGAYSVPFNGTEFTRNASKLTPATTNLESTTSERQRVLTASGNDWANGTLLRFFSTPIGTGRGARGRWQTTGAGNVQVGFIGNADTGATHQVRGEQGINETQKLTLSGGTAARAVLTATATLPVDGDTVTLGDTNSSGVSITATFTFRTTPAEWRDVKIGADANDTLKNLSYAIAGADMSGLSYYVDENGNSPAMRNVTSPTTDPTGLTLTLTAGAATLFNAYVSVTTVAGWSFGAATFTGGAQVSAGAFQLLHYGTFPVPVGTVLFPVGGVGVAMPGTITFQHGSASVTGTGTLWSSGTAQQKLNAGEYIRTTNGNEAYKVASIVDDTHLTISTSSVSGHVGWVGSRAPGLATVTNGSITATGVGTNFVTALTVGDTVTFGADVTQYTVATIDAGGLSITLTGAYAGTTRQTTFTRQNRTTTFLRVAEVTPSLNFNFTNDQLQTALEACPSISAGSSYTGATIDNTGSAGTLGKVSNLTGVRTTIFSGDWIRVTGDSSSTLYQVAAVDDDTSFRVATLFTAATTANGAAGNFTVTNVAVQDATNLTSAYKILNFSGTNRLKNILLMDVVNSTLTGGGYTVGAGTIGVPSGDQLLQQNRQGGPQGSSPTASIETWEVVAGTGFSVASQIDNKGAFLGKTRRVETNITGVFSLSASDTGKRYVATAAATAVAPAVGTLGNGFFCEFVNDAGVNCVVRGPGAGTVTVAADEIATVYEAHADIRVTKLASTVIS